MNTFQKIVKGLAIALAVFIIFSIISGILSVIGSILGIKYLANLFGGVTPNKISAEDHFEIETIESLCIKSGVQSVQILEGTEFKVIADEVFEPYSCKVEGKTLTIDCVSDKKIRISNTKVGTIFVYVPQEFTFDKVDLDLGVGQTDIDVLNTDRLKLNCGAGEVNLKNVEVSKEADIKCGVGEFNIEKSKITNLNFEAGVGEVNIKAELTGNCAIKSGVGEVDLTLENYNEEIGKIITKKGVGSFKVNGKNCHDEQEIGKGNDTIIKIDGGVGEIKVKY